MANGEFTLIQKISGILREPGSQIVQGIGDDCAVIQKNQNTYTVISTDCLVENIHFDLRYFSFLELGKKAMAVNLSDVAAMGAVAQYAVVSLGVPAHVSQEDILSFYAGIEQCLLTYGGFVVGGDLSQSKTDFFINITVVGECAKDHCKLRNAAQVGDGIYITGPLGVAALGLLALQKNPNVDSVYSKALKTPQPQMRISQHLSQYSAVHAMMDVSDGFLQDLGHILKASGVSAEVCVDDIPELEDFESECKKLKKNPLELKLSGGEDYQLLVTIDDTSNPSLLSELKTMGLSLTRVGRIVKSNSGAHECRVNRQTGEEYVPQSFGFDHFAKSKLIF